jgi:hypothetical protein
MDLLQEIKVPSIAGLRIPNDLCWILKDLALLAGMKLGRQTEKPPARRSGLRPDRYGKCVRSHFCSPKRAVRASATRVRTA